MSMNDPLSAALSKLVNCERNGRNKCRIKPISQVIKMALKIMNQEGYIGKFKEVEDGKGNYLVVNLLGKINKCGVIRPRYSCKKDEFVKYEKRFLLARDFGVLIVSTPKGLMTHSQAKEQNTGGRLMAYCY